VGPPPLERIRIANPHRREIAERSAILGAATWASRDAHCGQADYRTNARDSSCRVSEQQPVFHIELTQQRMGRSGVVQQHADRDRDPKRLVLAAVIERLRRPNKEVHLLPEELGKVILGQAVRHEERESAKLGAG
jgi:hypothetical protein